MGRSLGERVLQAMIDTITNLRLRRLYAYWNERRGSRRFPARADIDPLDLTFLMGNMILIDVIEGDPPGFFIRLHGTNLAQRAGYELTGKMLNDLPISRVSPAGDADLYPRGANRGAVSRRPRPRARRAVATL